MIGRSRPWWDLALFLPLFVDGSFFTPFAKLFIFYFALNFFLVFARPVIGPFAILADHFDKFVLCHVNN